MDNVHVNGKVTDLTEGNESQFDSDTIISDTGDQNPDTQHLNWQNDSQPPNPAWFQHSPSRPTNDDSWPAEDTPHVEPIQWSQPEDDNNPCSPIEPPPPPKSIYPLRTRPGWAVHITTYKSIWPTQFTAIQNHLHQVFTTSTPPASYTAIEHVGSTSIPLLPAKPNIDVLVTFPSRDALNAGIEALEWEVPSAPPYVRYTRVPNGGGIQGRESFKLYVPEWSPHYYDTPERSVYLIDESDGNPAGRIHVRCYRDLRDTLRDAANADLFKEYGDVKIELGTRIYDDSITYSALKNDIIRKVLRRAGWTEEEVDEKEKLSVRVWQRVEPAY